MAVRQHFRLAVVACLVCLLLFAAVPVFAQENQSPAISSGFHSTDTALVQGSLASTREDDASTVELATFESGDRLAGVVSSAAVLKIASDQSSTVQVVTGGTTLALVSDINGEIQTGDKITISPINGVGMLALSDGQIVGTALQSFDANAARSQAVPNKDGQSKTVHIGTIPVQVAVSYYTAPTSQFIPPFLGSLASDIAGRPVSSVRIVLGLILILLAFSSIFALIYTSVRAGMMSLGRNPLAAGAIHRGLASVAVITLLIMVSALVLTYLLLTL